MTKPTEHTTNILGVQSCGPTPEKQSKIAISIGNNSLNTLGVKGEVLDDVKNTPIIYDDISSDELLNTALRLNNIFILPCLSPEHNPESANDPLMSLNVNTESVNNCDTSIKNEKLETAVAIVHRNLCRKIAAPVPVRTQASKRQLPVHVASKDATHNPSSKTNSKQLFNVTCFKNGVFTTEKLVLEDFQIHLNSRKPEPVKSRLTFDDISSNKHLFASYTGLQTKDIFLYLHNLCERFDIKYFAHWTVKRVCRKDQLLMTLMKLRQNFTNDDLAFRFNVSSATINNIIVTWVHVLHEILCESPLTEQRKFSTLKECFIAEQTPSEETSGSEFISESTKEVKIEDSSSAEDLILADTGIVNEGVIPNNVRAKSPGFVKYEQLTDREKISSRKIAQPRAPIECTGNKHRLSLFKILKDFPPFLKDYTSQVFELCTVLVTLKNRYQNSKENSKEI